MHNIPCTGDRGPKLIFSHRVQNCCSTSDHTGGTTLQSQTVLSQSNFGGDKMYCPPPSGSVTCSKSGVLLNAAMDGSLRLPLSKYHRIRLCLCPDGFQPTFLISNIANPNSHIPCSPTHACPAPFSSPGQILSQPQLCHSAFFSAHLVFKVT